MKSKLIKISSRDALALFGDEFANEYERNQKTIMKVNNTIHVYTSGRDYVNSDTSPEYFYKKGFEDVFDRDNAETIISDKIFDFVDKNKRGISKKIKGFIVSEFGATNIRVDKMPIEKLDSGDRCHTILITFHITVGKAKELFK